MADTTSTTGRSAVARRDTFDSDQTAKNVRLQSAPMGNTGSSAVAGATDIAHIATMDAGSSTRIRRRPKIPSQGLACAWWRAASAIRTCPRPHALTRVKARRERRCRTAKSSRVAPTAKTTTRQNPRARAPCAEAPQRGSRTWTKKPFCVLMENCH